MVGITFMVFITFMGDTTARRFQITVTCIKERIVGRGKNIEAGQGRGVVIMSTSTSTQITNQKECKQRPTSAVNNTVIKLILHRRSCEKLHKKLDLPTRF